MALIRNSLVERMELYRMLMLNRIGLCFVSEQYHRFLRCSYFVSSSAGLGSSSGPPVPESRLGEENKGHQMLVKMGKMPF